MAHKRGESITPAFKVGDAVRVKRGVIDPNYSDIPLGGWAGIITEVEQAEGVITYLIAWSRETLKTIHPVFRKRCDRDGLEFESMSLGDEDIETDDGTPLSIEPPTAIKTPPLSEKDEDDRIRRVLGLTHDDPLPDVSYETLLTYHRYLKAHLTFPFKARSESDGRSLTVHRLLDPEEFDLDEGYGLLCEARDREGPFHVPLDELDEAGSGNRRLVRDYATWFVNYR
jgi:hypothetical protein